MGTPEFACAGLEAIIASDFAEVVAVVTVPDKPAGRGQQLRFSEVKKTALAHNLPVLQPEKLKNEQFLEQLKQYHADVFVVVAFRILPEVVYSLPPKGSFNLHASLLPDYRGAAPIQRAVMNGETKTGVTTFFLNPQVDCGDIIDQTEVEIGPNETTGELYDHLMREGAKLILKTLKAINEGTVNCKKQTITDENAIKPAPKILKDDMLIHWDRPAREIFNQIRGLSPYPGAFTRIRNTEGGEFIIKCYETEISGQNSTEEAGTLAIDAQGHFIVHTQDKCIWLKIIQFEGKKRMPASEFIRGWRAENYVLRLF
ncbi:MAG: methionyl-tRNA formyltransferase [Bacteroidales bacterium]|nr:methionyl-tRNA formyltransferase [Bacteroidales bacterium]